MTKRNPEFGGFSACFAVRAGTDRKGKATPPARTETDWAQTYTAALHGFQPTPPARTETYYGYTISPNQMISTHSAREDGDVLWLYDKPQPNDFNPLRPRGRRLLERILEDCKRRFQPTPPARTETQKVAPHNNLYIFQPTPPARTETCH